MQEVENYKAKEWTEKPVLTTFDIDDPGVAATELATAKRLTGAERRHLQRIRAVVHPSGKADRRTAEEYWTKKFAACSIAQLRRHHKRLQREIKILEGRRKRTIIVSYLRHLENAFNHFRIQANCLMDECERRGIKD